MTTKANEQSHFPGQKPWSFIAQSRLIASLWMILLATSLLAVTSGAQAQKYPNRPISLVVGYAPGGGTDIVGRALALELGKELGQPIVVDNRPGAGTLIATQYVKRAPADGYTLFFGTNGMVINSLLKKPTPYDVVKDFTPVGMVTVQSLALVVRPSLNIGSTKELIAYAKANPNKLNFASSGYGNGQHLAGVAFADATDIEIVHLPYKGAAPAIHDLIGGQVDMMFTGLLGLSEHIREKRMILLATTGKNRTTGTPDTPSVAEAADLPDFAVDSWQAVFLPANTPKAVVVRLSDALKKVNESGNLNRRFADQGMEIRISSPEELRSFIVHDRDQIAKLVKKID